MWKTPNTTAQPTFWSKTQSVHSIVMPVQGGICILLFLMEVSPVAKTKKVKQNLRFWSRNLHELKHWTVNFGPTRSESFHLHDRWRYSRQLGDRLSMWMHFWLLFYLWLVEKNYKEDKKQCKIKGTVPPKIKTIIYTHYPNYLLSFFLSTQKEEYPCNKSKWGWVQSSNMSL